MSDGLNGEPALTQGGVLEGRQQLAVFQKRVRQTKRILAWKRRRARLQIAATALASASFAAWMLWTALYWGDSTALVRGRWIFVPSLLVSVALLIAIGIHHGDRKSTAKQNPASVPMPERFTQSMAEVKERLEDLEEGVRILSASFSPSLSQRRSLYRENLSGVIEQYRAESRRYRSVHNSLQSLIMVGSTAVTTLAALEAKEWTWPTVSMIVLGFCVTIATAFTGYFKYRERSYFLQQTADAIEEEANALTLGVGEYLSRPEEEALALFTQRVETLRNDQRRRQQQLDQPAEQAPASNQAPV